MRAKKEKIAYKASKGAPFTDAEAPIVGQALEAIAKEHGDVTPHVVLDEARSEVHPLHKYFEWDKTKAAYNWNVHQARQIINHIRVTVIGGKDAPAMISVSVKVADTEDEYERSYRTIQSVLDDPTLRKAAVSGLLRDLETWCKKAEIYSELTPLVAYIRDHGVKSSVA